MFKKTPDDDFIENIDPLTKAWMYYQWKQDYNDEYELLKHQGFLIGSFTNPEAVQQMMERKTMKSDESEFDETSKKILDGRSPQRKRKRRKLLENGK